MINNRQAGRRRGRGGQQQRSQGNPGRQDNGNRIDNRARGNAAQLLEKYKNLARDSQMQGDRVNTEYYLQFADHYFRVLAETRSRFEETRRQSGQAFDEEEQEFDDDGEPVARVERQGQGIPYQGNQGGQYQGNRDEQQDGDDRPRRFNNNGGEGPSHGNSNGNGGYDRQDRGERQDRQDRSERQARPERTDRYERNGNNGGNGGNNNSYNNRYEQDRPERQARPERNERYQAETPVAAPAAEVEAPVEQPRRRGRPPRTVAAEPVAAFDAALLPPALTTGISESAAEAPEAAEEAPRRRGRPRLKPTETPAS